MTPCVLNGTSGDDYLDGEAGADSLYGGGGADVMFGGSVLMFRRKLKNKNTWRRIEQQENSRRFAA